MNKLSVVVTVYNEEKNIEKCLKSLKFADEILVVDNGSTDKTVEIAKKFTDKIYFRKNDPQNIDIQKNFGFSKAAGDWILSIDADEEISPELAKEISSKTELEDDINGYWIPRKNIIFGKWIQHSGWNPDNQLRLFRRGKGKYSEKHVHEPLKVDGKTAELSNVLIHYNYESVLQFIIKTSQYAQNEADFLIEKGYNFSYFDAVRFPLNEFLSRFFQRKGYNDGFHGLMLAGMMAFYHFLIFAFIWERKGFKEYEGDSFLSSTNDEFKKAGNEFKYWIIHSGIENIKNPLLKNLARAKRKLKIG